MRIIGNPVLGMNFRHHHKSLKLTDVGLFYVNTHKGQSDDILLTTNHKVILGMLGIYPELDCDDDFLVMSELEKSKFFFRSLFLNSATRPPYSELHWVKQMKLYLESRKDSWTERETLKIVDYTLTLWFPFLPEALHESTLYLLNRQKVFKSINGIVIKEIFPTITGPEIGWLMGRWNSISEKKRVRIALTHSVEDIIRELYLGYGIIEDIPQQ